MSDMRPTLIPALCSGSGIRVVHMSGRVLQTPASRATRTRSDRRRPSALQRLSPRGS